MGISSIYPEIIDNKNFRYLKIDENYVVTFVIFGLSSYIEMFKFKELFPNETQYTISMHYIKQNSMDVLRKISKSIVVNEVEVKDAKSSSLDMDVISKVKDDAKKMRYDMQINNQEIYQLYMIVKISSKNKEEILRKAHRFKTSLITKMLNVNTLNFRHLYGFLASCPFGIINKRIFSNYYMNLTTNNVVSLFPFYTKSVCEKNGVLIGRLKNSSELCLFDIFHESHLNSNVCIFGSSGSGKSYFTKLLVLRNYLKGIKQYVIDPEGEYKNLPGVIFDIKKDKINILEIFEEDLIEDYLNVKIQKVILKIKEICKLNDETDNINCIEEAIKEEYYLRNITNDINSIYKQDEMSLNKKIIDASKFPCINDIISNIESNKNIKKTDKQRIVKKIKDKFCNEYSFLNGVTNIDLKSDIVVFDISSIIDEKSEASKIIIDIIKNKIKSNFKSLIYIDEVWKLIYKNESIANIIFDLYKTVRKRNAGIITITQDVSDFFSKDTGGYGKSIFNNSYVKVFFKIEYQESKLLNSIGIIEEKEYLEMIKLNKGEMNMYINSEAIRIKVEASNFEKQIIEGSDFFDSNRLK